MFHINPETGTPSKCSARTPSRCKYARDGEVPKHYTTKAEAREDYENFNKDSNNFITFKKSSESSQKNVQLSKEELERRRRFYLSKIVPSCRLGVDGSKGFYNLDGVMDEESLKTIAAFQYWNDKESWRSGDDNEDLLNAGVNAYMTQLHLVYETEYGKHHKIPVYNPSSNRFNLVSEKADMDWSKKNWRRVEIPKNNVEDKVHRNFLHDTELRKSFMSPNRYAEDSLEFVKRLTSEENNAIVSWSQNGSTYMGSALSPLKTGIENDDVASFGFSYNEIRARHADFDEEEYLKTLDEALNKSDLKEKMVLYRGVSQNMLNSRIIAEEFDNVQDAVINFEDTPLRPNTMKWVEENYPVGAELEFPLPSSSSSRTDVAMGFGDHNGIIMEIKAKKAAPIGIISGEGNVEQEFLLPRTTKYRVVGVKHNVEYFGITNDFEEVLIPFVVVQLEQLQS